VTVKIKPISLIPYDQAISPQTIDALNSMLVGVNQLIGQANAPPGQGIESLSLPTVNPTTGQIISGGIRTGSITTPLTYVAAPTSITWYWDGTNGSAKFQIYRDDGTITPATTVGSPLLVANIPPNSPSTAPYFFYPYWDEAAQLIRFVTNNNSTIKSAVGNPPYAFPQANIHAAQQQILRGHIPLALTVVADGIVLPASAQPPASGGTGGGSGGGSGGGGQHPVV
jgi:hypothetical protein